MKSSGFKQFLFWPPGGGLKKEQGESLTGTVLLVDPPLNNRPIVRTHTHTHIMTTHTYVLQQ